MKKTVQINIGKRHFHIDEDAFQILNEYLAALNEHFMKDKESGTEIIEDIEQRMAEILDDKLTGNKQVITLQDVQETIEILGKIEDFQFADGEEGPETEDKSTYNRKEYRRLYRDPDRSYLGGVAAGLAAYFNTDPLLPRILFIALFFANGFGMILYLLLWIIVPKARTTAQKLQMKGEPVTIQNIEKSISDEYQKVKTNLREMRDSERFHKTEEVFSDILRGIGLFFKAIFKILIYLIGIAFIVAGIILIVSLGVTFFTRFDFFGSIHWPSLSLPDFSGIFMEPSSNNLLITCLVILIMVPLLSLIYAGIKLIFNIKSKSRFLRATALTAWILALIFLIILVFIEGGNYAFEAMGSSEHLIEDNNYKTLYLEKTDNHNYIEGVTVYSIFNFEIFYSRDKNIIMGKPRLDIERSYDEKPELVIKKYSRNFSLKDADDYLDELEYNWEQEDSILYFDQFFMIGTEHKWRFPKLEMTLKIPEDQVIYISEGMEDILYDIDDINFYSDYDMVGKKWIMTGRGLRLLESSKAE
jgi:phage shock protein PspC (stress-responsive transcriptional regulator)